MKAVFSILFLAALLLTVSCSKEKRLERRLHKGTGEWFIRQLTHDVYSNTNGELLTSETTSDAGSMVFLKTHFSWGGIKGTWTRTQNTLRMKTEGGSESVYEISQEAKKKMTLTNSTSEDGYTSVVTMRMERE